MMFKSILLLIFICVIVADNIGAEYNDADATSRRKKAPRNATATTNEARLKKKRKERENAANKSADSLLRAAQSESCNFLENPMAIVAGEVCGGKYLDAAFTYGY